MSYTHFGGNRFVTLHVMSYTNHANGTNYSHFFNPISGFDGHKLKYVILGLILAIIKVGSQIGMPER